MNHEQFDAMLERKGNALVKQLAYDIAGEQLTVDQAARNAAHWHVNLIRKRHGERYPALHYQALYEDLYKTGLRDFPLMVHNIKLKRPPFDPSHKSIEQVVQEQNTTGTIKLVPFQVTDSDYWVSFPLEGINPILLTLGVRQQTGCALPPSAFQSIMNTIAQERQQRCKHCAMRAVSRLFLILSPRQNNRLRSFIACETCTDQMKAEVS